VPAAPRAVREYLEVLDDAAFGAASIAPTAELAKTPTEIRRVGRQAMALHIEAAFEALLAAGEIDPTASMKSHHGMIRRWLQAHRPDIGATDEKPGDEAIRKTIAPLFEAVRSRPNKL